MNKRAELAADQGKYIRALVLAGFDVSLNADRKLAVHSKDGFEGAWDTAKQAWYTMKHEAEYQSA